VAARGIDVANIAHVVNFDLPREAEDFVHRVGRTGRMMAKGIASTFAAPAERKDLSRIERTLSIQMKRFRVRSIGEKKPVQSSQRIAAGRERPAFSY
jgi:ATP-dependent RNA helicase RhlE